MGTDATDARAGKKKSHPFDSKETTDKWRKFNLKLKWKTKQDLQFEASNENEEGDWVSSRAGLSLQTVLMWKSCCWI